MIIPTHDRLPLLHQRLPIPQLPIHGNRLIPPRERDTHLIHARLTRDLMLIIPGHERHRRILRQKTNNINIILHVAHALRQRHTIFCPVGERRLRPINHEDIFVWRCHIQRGQGAGFERVNEMPCHCQEPGVIEPTILHRLGDVFILRERAERGQVGTLAVIVPGDEFDEIRLELQQRQPAVEPDAAVLRIQPVQ